jgi:hypothetical protein
MKKLTFLAVLAFSLISASVIFAQGNISSNQLSPTAAQAQNVTVITPEKFQDFAAENVGKEVQIKGMVVHVCREGGKKMFIIGEDPDMRVKITPNDKIGVFKPELEGSTVEVTGIIEPIKEEAVPEEEKKTEDKEHSNYYHKPQFSINCSSVTVVEE